MKQIFICIVFICLLYLEIPIKAVIDPWAEMSKLEQSIEQTSFPKVDFNILNNGAIPNDSVRMCTVAINNTILKCSEAGGGRVIIPKGTFYSGGIRLKSNVNLYLEDGAILHFSTNPNDYLPVVLTRWEGLDCYNIQPLIYAYNETNIAISGKGTIDGQGRIDTWWPLVGKKWFGWKPGMKSQQQAREELERKAQNEIPVEERKIYPEDGLRPQMINTYQCVRVLIEGVTLINAPFWVIHPLMCQNLIVRDVTIKNHGPNGDGCDPESCNKVLIEKCIFETGDDCISIKSGRNNDGRRWNIPSQNIIIRDCVMKDGHGAIVIGSEISGGFKNLFVENCQMDSPNLDKILRIKSNICRGGTIENIFMRNISIGQCKDAVIKVELNYFIDKEKCSTTYQPVVRNVNLENIVSKDSEYGINIDGLPDSTNVYDFTFKNCRFDGVKKGNLIVGARNFKFENCTMNGIQCEK